MGDKDLDLGYHGFLSAIAGVSYPMPNFYEIWPNSRRFLWNLYIYFGYVIMVIELISLFIRVGNGYEDLGVVCACNVAIGYILQYLLKIIIFRRKEDLFLRLFKELQAISADLSKNPFGDDRYKDYYDKLYKKVVIIGTAKGILEFLGNFGLIAIFIIISIVDKVPENKITPALSWTPYDNGENPVYSLTCFFEFLIFGSVTVKNAVIDILFWAMLVVPTVQLRYLKHLLKIILMEKKGKLRKNEENKKVKDGVENGNNSESTKDLIWWIQRHQRVLKMVEDFGSLSSPFLAVNYLTTLMDLFMGGLVAISTSSWTIYQQIIINAIIMSNALQLYIVSWTGDALREIAEDVALDGMTIKLFTEEKNLRHCYLFILARTRRSLQIRFGGINPLSSQTFGTLIRLTMTYFVTIVQLRSEPD